MRSRDGNLPFLFTSLALIATLSFGTEYYYIGYRISTKNTQPYNENFSLSKAMQPCIITGTSNHPLVLKRLENESLTALLNREKNHFIEYASSAEIRIKSNDTLHQDALLALSSMTLPTQCYAVEFNNELVTITATQ